jgi:anti-anti-sigma regulatory factor
MADFRIIPDGHGFIVSGELDMAHEGDFAAAFADVLHSGGPVTVDMRQLVFMDSSGIKTIIAAAKASEDCIVLHGVHDEVQRGDGSDEDRSALEPPHHALHGGRRLARVPSFGRAPLVMLSA